MVYCTPNMNTVVKKIKRRLYISWAIIVLTMGKLCIVHSNVPAEHDRYSSIRREADMSRPRIRVRSLRLTEMTPS